MSSSNSQNLPLPLEGKSWYNNEKANSAVNVEMDDPRSLDKSHSIMQDGLKDNIRDHSSPKVGVFSFKKPTRWFTYFKGRLCFFYIF